MTDLKIHSGKYAGRHISDLCKDKKYMNWVMTTWTPGTAIPNAIHTYIQTQKDALKNLYTTTKDLDFVRDWLAVSYEGYKVNDSDMEWVQQLLGTTNRDITLGFLRNECVFKVGGEEFALKPMEVNERKDTFGAYRNEIQAQINDYRGKCFHNKTRIKCPETGILLKNDMNTHTDHHFRKKTFVKLVEEFNDANAIDFHTVEIENCGMFYRLKDRSMAEKWYSYHSEHAILRLIHSSANTNAAFYLSKYSEAPFEEKPKVKKPEAIPMPRILTFDEVVKNA